MKSLEREDTPTYDRELEPLRRAIDRSYPIAKRCLIAFGAAGLLAMVWRSPLSIALIVGTWLVFGWYALPVIRAWCPRCGMRYFTKKTSAVEFTHTPSGELQWACAHCHLPLRPDVPQSAVSPEARH